MAYIQLGKCTGPRVVLAGLASLYILLCTTTTTIHNPLPLSCIFLYSPSLFCWCYSTSMYTNHCDVLLLLLQLGYFIVGKMAFKCGKKIILLGIFVSIIPKRKGTEFLLCHFLKPLFPLSLLYSLFFLPGWPTKCSIEKYY